MLKVVSDGIDHVLFLCLGWPLSMAMFKCSLVDGYKYPFTGLIVAGAPLAFIGVILFLYKIMMFKGSSSSSSSYLHHPMNLSLINYLLISAAYAISQILSVTALTYSHLTFLRFVIISSAAETIAMPVISRITLKRELHANYTISLFFAFAAICINELALVDRQTTPTVHTISFSIEDGWEGPLLAFISRVIGVLGSVLSKKYIVQQGYKNKTANQKFNEEEASGNNGTVIDEINDYTTEVKPQLLSKNSFLFKRFELIKKLDSNFEDLRFEAASKDPYLENKFTEFRKLIGDNTVKVHQIVELPKFQSRPKFDYDVDYASLKEEELEEILNIDDEHQAKTRADIIVGGEKVPTNFKDLKRWEVQAIMKLESRERNYLEEFLKDYLEMKRTEHLFSGKDDLSLTKYDTIFDSMIYDGENFSTDIISNIELHAMMNLALCVVGFFAAFVNAEFYYDFYQINEVSTGSSAFVSVSFIDYGRIVYYLLAGLLYLLKPLVIQRLVVNHSSGVYFLLRVLAEAIIVLIASTYTNAAPYIRTNALIALVLVGIGQYANYIGIIDRKQSTEFASILELIKTFFAHDLEADQLMAMEMRLIQVHQLLGWDDFLRFSLDLIASRNPRQLLHSANPVLFMRQHFDLFYNRRTQNWGGGCPRPSVESIESAWKSSDRTDVWIDSIEIIRHRYSSEKEQWKHLKKHKANESATPKKTTNVITPAANTSLNVAAVHPIKLQ